MWTLLNQSRDLNFVQFIFAYLSCWDSIVAVHGLDGDALRTWTSDKNKICWLNHQDLLPKHLREARILTWGYNANVTSLKGKITSSDRILQHAHTLIAQLQADREVCCHSS
jgi:protein SERAC1